MMNDMAKACDIKGTSNKRLVPKLRFPEFEKEGEWEEKELYEVANRKIDKNKKNIKLPVLTNSAIYGVILQKDYFDRKIVTNDNLVNYQIVECNDFIYNPRISAESPVGPISRNKICLGIMSPLYTIFRFKDKKVDYFEYYFGTDIWHEFIKRRANYGARFDRINISTNDFFNLPIPYPSLLEQQKIAECLSSIDDEIGVVKEKVEQLKAHKKGLMQKLFPVAGKFVPEIRFPEFKNDGGWKKVILGEAFERISEKNVNNNRNVLTISAQYGLVSQYDYFNKNVAAANIKNYYFIHKGDFAYNKSRSQGYPFGVIRPLRRYESGVVSTLYICFRAKTNCCIDFYEQYFDTDLINDEISKIAQEGARNHGLLNISIDDFFNKVKILVPHLSEQQKIAECLSSIDELISLYENKVTLLEQHKKGLMQQLFPKL